MKPTPPGGVAAGPSTDSRPDPLAPLAALAGVEQAVGAARTAVDQVYRHRVMRRRSPEVSAEAALRAARASAALGGADWALEEVRRRSDFGADVEARTVGAALRATAEAGHLLQVWRTSPLRVLARLHLVAAGGPHALRPADGGAGGGGAAGEGTSGGGTADGGTADRGSADGGSPVAGGPVPDRPAGGADTAPVDRMGDRTGLDAVGRPRGAGEALADEDETGLPLPDADEVAARLDGLNHLLVTGTEAPALVVAAVVHGELQALRPFTSRNGVVARAAERVVLVGAGLDAKGVAPAEVGHAEGGADAYRRALRGYASGTPEGVADWIAHCGRAVELGARESVAVCEAMQRGAA